MPASRRATKRSSSSEGSSAQCRSSSTITSGRALEAPARKSPNESKSRKRACSVSMSGGSPRSPSRSAISGTIWATSAARLPSSQRRPTGSASRTYERSASDQGQYGRLPLGLVAASPVDAGAADPGVGRELLGRPRLADPGIARDQQQPPATGERALELGAHLLELGVAADEHAPGQALERVRRRLGRRAARRAASAAASISRRASAALCGRSSGRLASSRRTTPVERRRGSRAGGARGRPAARSGAGR